MTAPQGEILAAALVAAFSKCEHANPTMVARDVVDALEAIQLADEVKRLWRAIDRGQQVVGEVRRMALARLFRDVHLVASEWVKGAVVVDDVRLIAMLRQNGPEHSRRLEQAVCDADACNDFVDYLTDVEHLLSECIASREAALDILAEQDRPVAVERATTHLPRSVLVDLPPGQVRSPADTTK